MPIAPPSAAAASSRTTISHVLMSGTFSLDGPLLLGTIRSMPPAASASSSSSASGRTGPLGRRLDVDERAVARHHDVQVDVRRRVLGVVEVEQRLAVDDADGDRGDGAGQRLREPEAVERPMGGHPDAADRCAARAAVGLQDVAVEPERPLAERLEVGGGAHGPADQALDLDRAPLLPAGARLAAVRSPVEAGSSEYSAVIQPFPVP